MFKKTVVSYTLAAMTALGAVSASSFAHAQTAAAQVPAMAVLAHADVAKAPGHVHARHSGHDQGPRAGMHGRHHGKAWRDLNLTEAQRDELFRIRHDQAPALRQQFKEVREAKRKVAELTRADKFDEDAAAKATAELGKAQAQVALTHARSRAQMMAVLTPEQRDQLDKKKAERGMSRKAPAKAATPRS